MSVVWKNQRFARDNICANRFLVFMKKTEKDKLTLKQKLFCDYYLEGSGNATEAVVKAGYNVNKKNGSPDRILAKSIASENLTKPYIWNYIKQKLEEVGLTDGTIKFEHYKSIHQDDSWSDKLRGIDLYYKVTGAYAAAKRKNNTNPELDAFLDRARKILQD